MSNISEEESLSNYWRTKKSPSLPAEINAIKDGMKLLASVYDLKNVQVEWKNPEKAEEKGVMYINPAPLDKKMAPVDGTIVDVIQGEMTFDIGYKILDSEAANNIAEMRPYVKNPRAAQLIVDILEDYYISHEMSSLSGVAGEYMRETRKYYAPDQNYVDHAATFLNNIDNPQDQRILALADLLNAVANYGIIPNNGTLRASWLTKFVTLCNSLRKEIKGSPNIRRRKKFGMYSALEHLFQIEEDFEDTPQKGSQGMSKGNTGENGVWSPQPGSLSDQKDTESAQTSQSNMKTNISRAEDMAADGAEDLSADVMKALGAQGVRNDNCVILDAKPGNPNDLRYVKKESERLSRLLEMFRDMRWRKITGESSGKIHQQKLWRAGIALKNTSYIPKMFTKRKKMEDTGLAVCLVLDQSGSIGDQWERVLIPIAAGLTTGTHKDVDIWTCSYTTGHHGSVVTVLYRPTWQKLRTGVGGQGGTPSAVGLVASETLLKTSRKENKLVIHVTDGLPGGVGSMGGEESCAKALEYLNGKGIKVATLFVTGYYEAADSPYARKAFGENLQFVKDFDDVPKAVEALLQTTIKEIMHKER